MIACVGLPRLKALRNQRAESRLLQISRPSTQHRQRHQLHKRRGRLRLAGGLGQPGIGRGVEQGCGSSTVGKRERTQRIGRLIRSHLRILPLRPPAIGGEQFVEQIDLRDPQGDAVTLACRADQLPGPRWPAQLGKGAARLRTVLPEALHLRSHRLSRGDVQRVDQLLGGEPTPHRPAEGRARRLIASHPRHRLPLIRGRGHDQPGEVLQIVAADKQLAGQKPQQLRMRWRPLAPVARRIDKAAAHQPHPKPVGQHLAEADVGRARDCPRQLLPRALRPELPCGLSRVTKLIKRPGRRNLFPGRDRHAHDHLVEFFRCGRNAAARRHLKRRALQHRRHRKQIRLFKGMIGGVVAAGALHLHAQKRGAQHMGLGRHRHIIFRGRPKACRPPQLLAASHADQVGHKAVEPHVVEQAIVDVPAKGPAVVERRLGQRRVFCQHVHPVARPVVCPLV